MFKYFRKINEHIEGSHSKVDAIGSPQRAQRPVDSIKEVVCRGVVGWLYPLVPFSIRQRVSAMLR